LAELALAEGDGVFGTVRAATAKDEFESLAPGRSFADVLDVNDTDEAVATVVHAAVSRMGHLDVVVNNAGYGLAGAVEEISDREARDQMETNFFGPLKVLRASLPHMRSRKTGHVVNISSGSGFRGNFGLGLYNASKFALEGLSEALWAELKPFGIRVTIVEPGATRTRWSGSSLRAAGESIVEYQLPAQMREALSGMDGAQPGDPNVVSRAIFEAVTGSDAGLRIMLGVDCMTAVAMKLSSVLDDLANSIAHSSSAQIAQAKTLSLTRSLIQ
jgi:NAD(P)-dependent dehydrogenase (short-subunit alcohol dehydrogenase family)